MMDIRQTGRDFDIEKCKVLTRTDRVKSSLRLPPMYILITRILGIAR